MKILLIGGTGTISSAITRQLAETEHEVYLLNRGNRNFETYFVNGRYIKSRTVAKAIEDGFKEYLMQHKYPYV